MIRSEQVLEPPDEERKSLTGKVFLVIAHLRPRMEGGNGNRYPKRSANAVLGNQRKWLAVRS